MGLCFLRSKGIDGCQWMRFGVAESGALRLGFCVRSETRILTVEADFRTNQGIVDSFGALPSCYYFPASPMTHSFLEVGSS